MLAVVVAVAAAPWNPLAMATMLKLENRKIKSSKMGSTVGSIS